jgi:type I restriction enzyme S subunit
MQTSGIQILVLDHYLAARVPIPTLAVQRDAVARIAAAAVQCDALRGRAQAEVELLSEFRARLIADVVTGRVDVRGFATWLPELELGAPAANQTDDVDALERGEVRPCD